MINIDTKELESEIIAAFICDNDTHKKINELGDECFTNKYNKYFFNIIQKMYLNKSDINFATLRNEILGNEDSNKLTEIIMSYVENFVTASSIDSNITKLKDVALRKKVQTSLKKATQEIEDLNQSVDTIKNNLTKELKEYTNSLVNGVENVTKILVNTLEEIERQKDKKGMTTGFWKLDILTDRFTC